MAVLNEIFKLLTFYIVILTVNGFCMCGKLDRRPFFWVRLLLIPIFVVFGSSDFWVAVLHTVPEYYKIMILPSFLTYITATLILWCCFKIDFVQALFIQSIGYLFEHIVFNLKHIIGGALGDSSVGFYILSVIIECGICLFLELVLEYHICSEFNIERNSYFLNELDNALLTNNILL